jgi:hypothetical protein
MGACVSTPDGCVGGRLRRSSKNKTRKRRRQGLGRRVPSRLSDGSQDKLDRCAPSDRSCANPTFHGLSLSLSLSLQLAWSSMEIVEKMEIIIIIIFG